MVGQIIPCGGIFVITKEGAIPLAQGAFFITGAGKEAGKGGAGANMIRMLLKEFLIGNSHFP